MSDVLQRPSWGGKAIKGGDLFTLRKERDGRKRVAVCEIWSHIFGWELKLLLDGELQRSHVCRDHNELLDTSEQWKAAILEKGWTA